MIHCLNIAKALQTVEQCPYWMMFDAEAEADVLYINFQNPAQAATDSEVTDDDVVIRYAGDEVIGLTILSVSQRQSARWARLVETAIAGKMQAIAGWRGQVSSEQANAANIQHRVSQSANA